MRRLVGFVLDDDKAFIFVLTLINSFGGCRMKNVKVFQG
jgi:hypothetical protein